MTFCFLRGSKKWAMSFWCLSRACQVFSQITCVREDHYCPGWSDQVGKNECLLFVLAETLTSAVLLSLEQKHLPGRKKCFREHSYFGIPIWTVK